MIYLGGAMRSSFYTRSVLALLAVAVLASTVYSQTESAKDKDKEKEKKRTRADVFQELDRNGDDMLTPTEWPGNERSFRHMDANHDGVVSREEFLSLRGRHWNERFEDLDFNGDGVIARAEWVDDEEAFNRLDRNHDGVIDRREFYRLW